MLTNEDIYTELGMRLDFPNVVARSLRDCVIMHVGAQAGVQCKPLSSCPYRKHQRRYCWEKGWVIGRIEREEQIRDLLRKYGL